MRIVYLITAYANFAHLEKLIESLRDEEQDIIVLVHLDSASTLPPRFPTFDNVRFIERIRVWWGGWSHQQAILNLMKAALPLRPDYCILISGGDYPIRPREDLYGLLASKKQFISLAEGFSDHKPKSRVSDYHFDAFDRRKKSLNRSIFLAAEMVISAINQKRNYPFEHIFHGSTWWALTGECTEYVINYLRVHPTMERFYRTSFCPEESMIHTILGNSHYREQCVSAITYIDWSVDPGPAFIREKHLPVLRELLEQKMPEAPYFARKFTDQSRELVEYIDENLR